MAKANFIDMHAQLHFWCTELWIYVNEVGVFVNERLDSILAA